jgi:hypothetical protein
MVATVLMTTLCVTGVAFYIRFLVALALESRNRWICYLVNLRFGSTSLAANERQKPRESITRAA